MQEVTVQTPRRPGQHDAAGRAGYTFLAAIAKGGMGYVELCCRRDGRFLRWAARKRLHEQLRGDVTFRTMFMDEARLAGLIRHPNVVGVSDVGEDADGPYLIMDYVEGLSLSRLARQAARDKRPIPLQVAVRICKDAATGLHAAHEARAEDGSVLNLVHRDVSPQNILVGFDGSVRVTDFGIAKALGNATETSAGVLKGNMGYLSPEQLRFDEPDRRSDLFSLGVTLCELVTGQRLYANKNGFEGTRRILLEPPPDVRKLRSDVPDDLAELLPQMLDKDPAHRPATALEVAARLERILVDMMKREGAVTVADYMDQHFASARERHRGFLAERLRATVESPTAFSTTRLERRMVRTRRRRWRGWLGAIAAVAVAAAMSVRWTGRHGTSPPPPQVLAAATPSQVEVVPLPPPELPATPVPVATTTAASDTRARTSETRAAHHGSSHRRRTHRTSPPAAPALSDELTIPLFTRWR